MLRRPVKQEKKYSSYTDIDVESSGDKDPCSPFGSCSSSTIAFKLTGLLKKQWQSFSDTNFAICQESTEFVVQHKPTFDKEKLKLIQLSTFIENDITCGTVTAIKDRSQYDGPLLDDQTFSPEWNQDARKINELVTELNRQIVRENLLNNKGGSFAIPSITSCFTSDDNMSPMPIEMSQRTVMSFAQNPRLFLQSPMHAFILCILVFALIGLCVTLSVVLGAISMATFIFIAIALALYQMYIHRHDILQGVEDFLQSSAFLEGREMVTSLFDKVKKSFGNSRSGGKDPETVPP